jgi:pSer/pThr/pTyr-binding forkhead associated (FHA) protein
MRPKLVLVAGKADKAEIRLKLPTIVGRTRDAGLMIAHKTVSRRHCELFERHGMMFVRDTGSRNGTLVDNAPVKESMVKPGHTLTIGPLTFRADYEPADSFIRSEDPDEPMLANGAAAADSGIADEAAADTRSAKAAALEQTTKLSETPASGELEFEELGPEDGGDIELPAIVDVNDDLGSDSDDSEHGSKGVALGSADTGADDEFGLDDDLAMALDDLNDGAPAAAEAKPGAGEDLLAFEVTEDTDFQAAPDALPDIEPVSDDLSFDLVDEPTEPAKSEAPTTAALDDGDLGFDLESLGEPASPAADDADDLGFTLEDLDETPAAAPAPAEPAKSNGKDASLSFDVAEPKPAKAAAKKGTADPAAKVPLGEEKPSGGDSEMSRFMKELGL